MPHGRSSVENARRVGNQGEFIQSAKRQFIAGSLDKPVSSANIFSVCFSKQSSIYQSLTLSRIQKTRGPDMAGDNHAILIDIKDDAGKL